jgi:hypothetical protein
MLVAVGIPIPDAVGTGDRAAGDRAGPGTGIGDCACAGAGAGWGVVPCRGGVGGSESGASSTVGAKTRCGRTGIGLAVTAGLLNRAIPSATPPVFTGDDDPGVVCRNGAVDAGDWGRRNGDDLGVENDNGDGLKACDHIRNSSC